MKACYMSWKDFSDQNTKLPEKLYNEENKSALNSCLQVLV